MVAATWRRAANVSFGRCSMQSGVVDPGPPVALFDKTKLNIHRSALPGPSVGNTRMNIAVITERRSCLGFSVEMPIVVFSGWIRRRGMGRETQNDLPRIATIMRKPADLPAGFSDALLVALAWTARNSRAGEVDNNFNIYRTLDRDRLRNVFLAARRRNRRLFCEHAPNVSARCNIIFPLLRSLAEKPGSDSVRPLL